MEPSFNEKLIMAKRKSGMDVSTTFLTPYLSAKNPATGLIINAPRIRIGKPLMICSTDQPNSSINGAKIPRSYKKGSGDKPNPIPSADARN